MQTDAQRALDIVLKSNDFSTLLRPGKRPTAIDFFAYNVKIPSPSQFFSATAFIQTQSDSDFIMTYMSGSQSLLGGVSAAQIQLALIQITDTSNGKKMFGTGDIPSVNTLYTQGALGELVFGLAGYPYVLSAPRVFYPNTNIQIDLTSLNVLNYDYYISLMGHRIYYG